MGQGHLRNLSPLTLLLRDRVLLGNLELTEELRLSLNSRASCPGLPPKSSNYQCVLPHPAR